jgi:hypothetical protein
VNINLLKFLLLVRRQCEEWLTGINIPVNKNYRICISSFSFAITKQVSLDTFYKKEVYSTHRFGSWKFKVGWLHLFGLFEALAASQQVEKQGWEPITRRATCMACVVASHCSNLLSRELTHSRDQHSSLLSVVPQWPFTSVDPTLFSFHFFTILFITVH